MQAMPQASQQEKARALTELGLEATPALLRLTDRNFVFEVWKIAEGPEVRASAELAMAPADDEACTQWIKTGAQEAHARDRANEQRDIEAARQAMELKRNGAAAIYLVVVDPDVLLRSYQGFVHWLWERAPGPKVKAAAWAAFEGTEEQQKEFLSTGIFAAHKQDLQDQWDADEQATEAEKAAAAWRAVKVSAAARVGLVATDELLVLPDDGFIWEIWERSTQGTEVYLAATTAVRSKDPVVWKQFIETGVHEAFFRDWDKQLATRDADNRRRAQQIQTKAANSRVHPALYEAAATALAGAPDDVERFLAVGQYKSLAQSFEALSKGQRGQYVTSNGGTVYLSAGGTQQEVTWKVVPGLADPNCHSLESDTRPDHFLMVNGDGTLNGEVFLKPSDDSPAFRRNATWCAQPGKINGEAVSLESLARPGAFLRHRAGQLYAGKNGPYCVPTSPPSPGQLPGQICVNYNHPDYFPQEVTWHVSPPEPAETSAITSRYLNDDAVRALLGKPVTTEQVAGSVRHRAYERGRLYWSNATGTRAIYGNILGEYLRLGGHEFVPLGAPINDESGTPDGVGRYNHFAGQGSIYWTPGTGAHAVYGPIRAKWASLGWERSYLGYPTSSIEEASGLQRQLFQGGRVEHNQATGVTTAYPN